MVGSLKGTGWMCGERKVSADRAVWRVAEFGRWMSGKRKGWDARSVVSGCSRSLGGNARAVLGG